MTIIAIEGNIGSGKTSFSRFLAGELNARLILEEFHTNPFLEDFYKDPLKFALPAELHFLISRHEQLKNALLSKEEYLIVDYTFTKSLVFAEVNLSGLELDLFRKYFENFNTSSFKPDVIAYLHLPVDELQNNILKRARDFESSISDEYLMEIEKSYRKHLFENDPQKTVWFDLAGKDLIKDDFLRQKVKDEILSFVK